jgi:hypothetical protein
MELYLGSGIDALLVSLSPFVGMQKIEILFHKVGTEVFELI